MNLVEIRSILYYKKNALYPPAFSKVQILKIDFNHSSIVWNCFESFILKILIIAGFGINSWILVPIHKIHFETKEDTNIMENVTKVLMLALRCTEKDSRKRPTMTDVAKQLSDSNPL
ncbi:hypothetical protein P8452_05813 [Trifolium repens]|nr:hypothetical protein P8452_05813 [Trifolium repens]